MRASFDFSRRLTLDDFYRTGMQDCENVFDASELDLTAGTPEQILDKAFDEWDAAGMEDQWRSMQDDLEGLDPHEAYESWKEGWKSCAVGRVFRALEHGTEHDNPPRRGPEGWWRRKVSSERLCYPTKAEALTAFLQANWELVAHYSGPDHEESPAEFDAINHKYDLKGKRRVRSIADAVWVAMPVGKPYCLDRLDLEALNDCAPARDFGRPFILPSAAYDEIAARKEAEHYRRMQEEEGLSSESVEEWPLDEPAVESQQEEEYPAWVTEHIAFPPLPSTEGVSFVTPGVAEQYQRMLERRRRWRRNPDDESAITYSIPEPNLDQLKKKLDKLVAKSRRLGVSQIAYSIGDPQDVMYERKREAVTSRPYYEKFRGDPTKGPLKETVYIKHYPVSVSGVTPRIGGWSFVATLQHLTDDDGKTINLLRVVPGHSDRLPEKYRTADASNCDHCCRMIRTRKDTFILRNNTTGEYQQVGRSCTQDFLGGKDPHEEAKLLEYMLTALADAEEGEDWSGGGGGDRYESFAMSVFLSQTAAVIRKDGWLSRGKARQMEESGGASVRSTADITLFLLSPPFGRPDVHATMVREYAPQEVDRNVATAALEYARESLGQNPDRNDYEHNLYVALTQSSVSRRTAGIVASAIPYYLRHVEQLVERQKSASSQWVGKLNERSDFIVVPLSVKQLDTQYGTSYLHRFITSDGNILTWFASTNPEVEIGKEYQITATVKKHDEYKGAKQTVVTRVVVWTEEGRRQAEAKEAAKAEKAAKKAAREAAKAAKMRGNPSDTESELDEYQPDRELFYGDDEDLHEDILKNPQTRERRQREVMDEIAWLHGMARSGMMSPMERESRLESLMRELDILEKENRGLHENPPWVTKIIAKNYEALEEDVPAQWLPKLGKATATGNKLTARVDEYGCGAYGCVLPTIDDAVVLKVTTDDTEYEFATKLADKLTVPVVVKYHLSKSMGDKYKGHETYLLWRDSADQVGELMEAIAERGGDTAEADALIAAQHRAGQAAYEAMFYGKPAKDLIEEWVTATREMGKGIPELSYLAEGMIKNLRKNRVFFGDVHDGNIGLVDGKWKIIDPGHVAVLTGKS